MSFEDFEEWLPENAINSLGFTCHAVVSQVSSSLQHLLQNFGLLMLRASFKVDVFLSQIPKFAIGGRGKSGNPCTSATPFWQKELEKLCGLPEDKAR